MNMDRYNFTKSYDFSDEAGRYWDLQKRLTELKQRVFETEKDLDNLMNSLPANIKDMLEQDRVATILAGNNLPGAGRPTT